jgi:hypothetical protein
MSAGRTWLVPSLVGLVVAGAPLGYYVVQVQGQVTQLKTQAATDAATAAATITQLRATLASNADTITKLQADKSQLAATTVAQEATEQRLAKPDLPLELTFRHELLDGPGVLHLHVTNASHTIVTVEVAGLIGGIKTQPTVYKFPADHESVIRKPTFSSGDKVAFVSPDYRPIVRVVQ